MKPGTALDFETLVERYYQPVFSFAVKLCGQLDRALELTQHTFCRALNHESYFGETQSAKSWLFNLLFCEFLRERRLDRPLLFSVTPQGRSATQTASTPILAALRKVRKELQAPLLLFYAKDLSFSQTADYLGIPVDAVLKLLSQGREELSLAVTPSVSRDTASLAGRSRHRRGLPLAA